MKHNHTPSHTHGLQRLTNAPDFVFANAVRKSFADNMISAIPDEAAAWVNIERVSLRRNKVSLLPVSCMKAWKHLK